MTPDETLSHRNTLRELNSAHSRLRERMKRGEVGETLVAAAMALVHSTVEAGSRVWNLSERDRLQDIVAFWIGVINDYAPDDFVPTPPIAEFEGELPGLQEIGEKKLLELAADEQPIFGVRVTGAHLEKLRSPSDRPVMILDSAFDGCHFDGAALPELRLVHTTFKRCTFVRTQMESAVATSSIFGGCDMTELNAVRASFSGTRFHATEMRSAHFDWVSFAGAGLRSLSAEGAFFNDALFDLTVLGGDVDFADAKFVGALFLGATVKSRFVNTDLTRTIFSTSSVSGADFRGATIDGASFLHARDVSEASFDPDAPRHAEFREVDAAAVIAPPGSSSAHVKR